MRLALSLSSPSAIATRRRNKHRRSGGRGAGQLVSQQCPGPVDDRAQWVRNGEAGCIYEVAGTRIGESSAFFLVGWPTPPPPSQQERSGFFIIRLRINIHDPRRWQSSPGLGNATRSYQGRAMGSLTYVLHVEHLNIKVSDRIREGGTPPRPVVSAHALGVGDDGQNLMSVVRGGRRLHELTPCAFPTLEHGMLSQPTASFQPLHVSLDPTM